MPETTPVPIRVLIADDHDIVRRALAILIRAFDDLELVGSASNGLDAVKLAGELHPDVILMNPMMPGMDGIEATHTIRKAHPEIQVVALIGSRDVAAPQAMLDAGAVSTLSKNMTIDELAAAIRSARSAR